MWQCALSANACEWHVVVAHVAPTHRKCGNMIPAQAVIQKRPGTEAPHDNPASSLSHKRHNYGRKHCAAWANRAVAIMFLSARLALSKAAVRGLTSSQDPSTLGATRPNQPRYPA